MSLKSRALRITLIVLAVLGVAGYLAFTTAFFNPMEGRLEVDPGALVPRDVDFFVAKAGLKDEITRFPRTAAQDRLDKNPGWRKWLESPEYAAFERENKLEESLAELRVAAEQLPLGQEPQDLFGGEDVVLAGYFKGRDLQQADWAAYGRSNFWGKLAAAALLHPTWIGLEKRGIQATVNGAIVTLNGAQLPRTLYVTRLKDVIVIATKPELAQAARDLDAKRYADSFFQSATYFDNIQNAPRRPERREFELFVNTRKLLENLGMTGSLPNVASQEFGTAFLGRLFQVPSMKNVVGVMNVDEGLALDLHGEFASETITPRMQAIYRTRGFDQSELLTQAAQMAPADTAFFGYLRADIGDLLRMMLESAEPAARNNLEDLFRNTGKYPNLETLVKELEGALKDRAVVIVRPNDYPPDPEGPPHNQKTVPAFALVLWPKNFETIVNLRELIGQQGARFGLAGRTPQEAGFYKNKEGGFETREYWSVAIDGTGVIVTGNVNEVTIVSNSLGMIQHLHKTFTQGGPKYPRLSQTPLFEALVQSSRANGNACVWVNPKTLAPILRSTALQAAEDEVLGVIDWKAERARLEDQVIREKFPGQKRGALPTDVQDQVDAIVDPKLKSLEQKKKAEEVPQRLASRERTILYLEQITGFLGLLAVTPKTFDLSVRSVLVPPEESN